MTDKIEIALLKSICTGQFTIDDMFFETKTFYYISGMYPDATIKEMTDALDNVRDSLLKNM